MDIVKKVDRYIFSKIDLYKREHFKIILQKILNDRDLTDMLKNIGFIIENAYRKYRKSTYDIVITIDPSYHSTILIDSTYHLTHGQFRQLLFQLFKNHYLIEEWI